MLRGNGAPRLSGTDVDFHDDGEIMGRVGAAGVDAAMGSLFALLQKNV